MIDVEEITTLVELCVWSSVVEGETNPTSLILVASPESGKTDIITRYGYTPWTIALTDVTNWGFTEAAIKPLIKAKPNEAAKRLVIIPDLTNVLSRAASTVASLISVLQAYMEEGVGNVQTYVTTLKLNKPIRGGIITSITPSEFMDKRRTWNKTGFASRFLVASYTYSESTRSNIMQHLLADHTGSKPEPKIELPDRKIKVSYHPAQFHQIEGLAKRYADIMQQKERGAVIKEPDLYGFRMVKHIKRLMMAATLRHGADFVMPEDLDLVSGLIERYCNIKFRESR